ncbi:MAG TPA: alkaline phosphatase family protein [Methylomirabilota bacterium]
MRRIRESRIVPWLLSVILALGPVAVAGADDRSDKLQKINHIVVIYQENHSFDNLYGGWEGVNGRANADAAHTQQINQSGAPFNCLLQDDVNLTSPSPLPTTCTETITLPAKTINSDLVNKPFYRRAHPAHRHYLPAPQRSVHGQRLQERYRPAWRVHS